MTWHSVQGIIIVIIIIIVNNNYNDDNDTTLSAPFVVGHLLVTHGKRFPKGESPIGDQKTNRHINVCVC